MTRSIDAVFDDADLNGFVDGRIDPTRATALAESLASDPDAQARIDGWKRQNESLRTMFASVLYEPVPARLVSHSVSTRTAISDEGQSQRALPDPGIGRGVLITTSLGMALVGFALGALASLGLDDVGLYRHGSPGLGNAGIELTAAARSLSDVAVEAHRTFVEDGLRPVELSAADAPKLTRWIQRRLGPEARIPDFERQGWSLVGGRILPGPRGPAAFLLYGNGADRLGLTLSRSSALRAETTAVGDRADPVSSTAWTDEAYDYVLTSSHGPTWMGRNTPPLIEAVRTQAGEALPVP